MIKTATLKYSGLNQLLLNNPQTVDPLNKYTKLISVINKKRVRTEEDINHRYELEVASKIYWSDENHVQVPTSWVVASVCKVSNLLAKIAKASIRSCLFPTKDYVKLYYDGHESVKTKDDVIYNESPRWLFPTKQGQNKIMKAFPMFDNWSFEVDVEYDDSILPECELIRIAEYAAKYNGFGDFRPTYGRAVLEV